MLRRISGGKGWSRREAGRAEEDRESEFKTAAKGRVQKVLKATGSGYNRLSFQNEGAEKDYVRQIGQGGRSSRGAIGHSGLRFPKVAVQREVVACLKAEWEIRAAEAPMVPLDRLMVEGEQEQSPRQDH
jgi:hypothetical protein